MVYKKDLERIKEELLERKNDLLQELKHLPDGEFMSTECNGVRKYLQRLPAKGNRKKERRYGIKKKPETLMGLVRKKYIKEAIPIIEHDIQTLDVALESYRMIDENSVMEGFIAKYIHDTSLRSVLAYMNPLYGGRKDQTPAYIHAIICSLYINGASRFVDGSQHYADALAKVITERGGRVLANEGVEWIEVKDRHVDFVKTRKGTYTADYYISDIHPCTLLTLMDEKAFPKSYRERLNNIPNAYSAFALYIKLKKDSFPYINHSEYYMTRYDDIWNFGQSKKPWPMGFLFMTPPDDHQPAYATKALVTAPMIFEEVQQWADTTVGHRGDNYLKWKEEKTAVLLRKIEEMHPGFGDCIEAVNASSPLTIRDFYGVKEGSICGFSKDYKNIALSQVPVITKISNLLLTGQNNNLHGFCGVTLTAINTCEAILGQNVIINKINETVRS